MRLLFDVIYIDPPWNFRVWNKETGSDRSADKHYQTEPVEKITDFKIGDLAADNCAMFIWATWPTIFDQVPPVLDAWGFTYRTLGFDWVKLTKDRTRPVMGAGYYTRANSEPCLLAVKGSMPRAKTKAARSQLALIESIIFPENPAQFESGFVPGPTGPDDVVIRSPRRSHSEKPEEGYQIIEALYPGARKIEVFARKPRIGWTSIGNEITGRDLNLDIKLLTGQWNQPNQTGSL